MLCDAARAGGGGLEHEREMAAIMIIAWQNGSPVKKKKKKERRKRKKKKRKKPRKRVRNPSRCKNNEMKTVNVKREIDVPAGGACAAVFVPGATARRPCQHLRRSSAGPPASLLSHPASPVTVKCGSRTITVTGPRGTLTRSFKTINFAIQQEKDQKKVRRVGRRGLRAGSGVLCAAQAFTRLPASRRPPSPAACRSRWTCGLVTASRRRACGR